MKTTNPDRWAGLPTRSIEEAERVALRELEATEREVARLEGVAADRELDLDRVHLAVGTMHRDYLAAMGAWQGARDRVFDARARARRKLAIVDEARAELRRRAGGKEAA